MNQGLVVAEVAPEAVSEDSPLGRLQDGDPISVDMTARRVDVLVDEGVLWQREPYRKQGARPKGWLGIYAHLVTVARKGALVEAP